MNDDNPLTRNQADPYLAIFDMPTKGEAGVCLQAPSFTTALITGARTLSVWIRK